MPLRLIVLRHAKSSWTDDSLEDHDRPLNARGRSASDAIGAWLAANEHAPDEVLCSSAVRTQETWQRVAAHLNHPPSAVPRHDLYLAEPTHLLEALADAQGRCVALVGHNPGIGQFAAAVLASRPAHKEFDRFPTLATLVADFDLESWRSVAPGTGRLVDFVVPRDLTD